MSSHTTVTTLPTHRASMQRPISIFALFVSGWMLAPAVASGDIYQTIYRNAVEAQLNNFDPDRTKLKQGGITPACYAWLLAEATGESRYRDLSLALYDRFLTMEVNHDFHASRPFGLLTLRIDRAGKLTDDRRSLARRQAQQRIDWFLDQRKMAEEWFDCNISLADTLAVACLAKVFVEEPNVRSAEIQRAVDAFGKRILSVGDLNENASNYSTLGICFFLELARLEGWLDEVAASPEFYNMFVRQREIISPAGRIPEFGDSYFRWDRCRLDFACAMEWAARLFGDATFQETADRLFPPGMVHAEDDQLNRGYLLLDLPKTPELDPPSWPAPSLVLTRRLPTSPIRCVPDKLILRTGRRPGDAMAMIDLYADGSHAHRFKRPSIGYFEVAGVPLFHNLGRRGTRSALCGNSFWIWENADAFPGYPREGEWNTMTVPTSYCLPGQRPGDFHVGRDLLFRNFPTRDLKLFRLDNLRLEGPQGTLLLDGFESPRTWHANVSQHPDVQLASSSDRTEGTFSQQVNWQIFGEQYCTRLFEQENLQHTDFPLTDYDVVRFDYKYEGQHPRCNLRNLFRPGRWINLGNRSLECEVLDAEAGQLGRDAWGRVQFGDYNEPGNQLVRQIVLTSEGVLVIVDRFAAGLNTSGWAGGQLWQLYAMGERGDDWFASDSDGVYRLPDGEPVERRMLVKYMRRADTQIGFERVIPPTMHAPTADGGRHREFFTTYSQCGVSPGKTITAAMVVLPLGADDQATEQASGVMIEQTAGGGVEVRYGKSDQQLLRVTIPETGSPSCSRSQE